MKLKTIVSNNFNANAVICLSSFLSIVASSDLA